VERIVIVLANSVSGVGMPAAVAALRAGLPALDSVEAGIRPVEADPTIDSVGVGGWPNLLGQVELDASIMDGRTLHTGAVAALQGFHHPISVARQVMARLPHVLLADQGAARFAAEIGAEAGEILTEEARSRWEAWLMDHVPADTRARWPAVPLAEWARLTADPETAGGTTTFLVRDAAGDLAIGVSTCGWAFNPPVT
jgi:L-asparaginase